MKRVRCPKCDNFITFDETKYQPGQSLVFECPECNKQFGIRIGVSKLRNTQKEEKIDEQSNENGCGSIVVIENVFHYKQVIPLQLGDNIIGRYMNEEAYNKTIETKKVTFWSRSRNCLWTKGETSGNFLNLVDIKIDCDNDTLLVSAHPNGPT